jgi:hypothetical protein
MWCRVDWQTFINVSKEHTVSVFKVEKDAKQSAGKKQAATRAYMSVIILMCNNNAVSEDTVRHLFCNCKLYLAGSLKMDGTMAWERFQENVVQKPAYKK